MTPRAQTLLASLPERTQATLAARGLTPSNVLDLACERWNTGASPGWCTGWGLSCTLGDDGPSYTASVTYDFGNHSDKFPAPTALEAALVALESVEGRLSDYYQDYDCEVPY